MCPHAADVDDGTALAIGDHARNDGLCQEEQRVVELHVGVIELLVVLEKRPGDEKSRRVYQQGRVVVLLGQRTLYIRDGSAISQFGGDAPGVATPVRQLSDGVIDTVLRTSDDHRAAAMVDDIESDLPTHAGTAADNDDLLAVKVHVRVPSWLCLTAPRWAAASNETATSRAEPASPQPLVHPGDWCGVGRESSSAATSSAGSVNVIRRRPAVRGSRQWRPPTARALSR